MIRDMEVDHSRRAFALLSTCLQRRRLTSTTTVSSEGVADGVSVVCHFVDSEHQDLWVFLLLCWGWGVLGEDVV